MAGYSVRAEHRARNVSENQMIHIILAFQDTIVLRRRIRGRSVLEDDHTRHAPRHVPRPFPPAGAVHLPGEDSRELSEVVAEVGRSDEEARREQA